MKEIAFATGFSKATVSRALRGLASVAPETTLAVRDAADRLGYIPSVAASGLATGHHRAIGVLVPLIDRWFYVTALEGIDSELRRAGYDLVLFNLGGGSAGNRERVFHRSILRGRVDALIVLCLVLNDSEQEQLQLADIPTVIVGGPVAGIRHFGIDDTAAATLAVTHLLNLGHTRIAHIGGEDDFGLNSAVPFTRRSAFLDVLHDAGAHPPGEWVVNGRFTFDGGYHAMQAILAGTSRPSAVFAASDEMAFGAMAALCHAAIDVPGEISIIAIDGHQDGEALGLTTIAQSPLQQGADAARLLLSELDGRPELAVLPPAPCELIIRGSTALPRATGIG